MTDEQILPAEISTIPTGGRIEWQPSGPQLNALLQPLNKQRVATRKQGGSTLSYLEAWDIKRMLTRIFGFASWSADLTEGKVLRITETDEPVMNWSNGKPTGPKIENGEPVMKHMFTVLAQCTMRLTIHASGATYTETSVASQKGPDIGEVADFAIKTAESDALKRAAINLGTQFGLSLYDDGSLEDVVGRVMEDGQKETIRGYREQLAAEQQKQRDAVAQGAPIGGTAPQQPQVADEQPMATADYSQGDPNAQDGLQAPSGSGTSAVAGAFARGRQAPQ